MGHADESSLDEGCAAFPCSSDQEAGIMVAVGGEDVGTAGQAVAKEGREGEGRGCGMGVYIVVRDGGGVQIVGGRARLGLLAW